MLIENRDPGLQEEPGRGFGTLQESKDPKKPIKQQGRKYVVR